MMSTVMNFKLKVTTLNNHGYIFIYGSKILPVMKKITTTTKITMTMKTLSLRLSLPVRATAA
jgi:hypothetical protein